MRPSFDYGQTSKVPSQEVPKAFFHPLESIDIVISNLNNRTSIAIWQVMEGALIFNTHCQGMEVAKTSAAPCMEPFDISALKHLAIDTSTYFSVYTG